MEALTKIQLMLQDLIASDTWVIQVFVVVFVALVADFIQKRVVRKMLVKAEETALLWDDAVLISARRPTSLLIWVLGLTVAADIVHSNTQAAIFEIAPALREVGVIASLVWFMVRFIHQGQLNIIKKRQDAAEPVDETTILAIAKLLRLSVIITGILVIMQTLGFSISGVLAFGGIGGIAVGFAAKDLLANFFGGLMIYLDRPFSVGEWIRSPDKEIEGTVEDIGWRLTRIRTFDKRPLYVPNSVFASITVENPSRMTNRRIKETIGVRYDDAAKIDGIVRDVKAMLENHDEIDSSKTLIVNLNSFAPSSLDFFIYTFTKTIDWVRFHEIKQDVLLKILAIIESHGAECAFPTSTLHVASLAAAESEGA